MIRANGVGIAYDDLGAGPAMILVHGSWADRRAWDAVFRRLASSGFRVIRYDRRGHGESERAGGTLADDAEDLGALIEALDASPAHVVCSSRGGTVALKLAARRPGPLRSLVCHEPPVADVVPPDHPARADLDRVLAEERDVCELIVRGEHEAAAERFVDAVAFGPGAWTRLPERVRASFASNASTFLEECRDPDAHAVDLAGLGAFQHPVLLTRGERSPSWYGAILDVLRGALPRAFSQVYRGAGHVPQATLVGPYVRAVAAFAAAVDAGTDPDPSSDVLRRDMEHLAEDHEGDH